MVCNKYTYFRRKKQLWSTRKINKMSAGRGGEDLCVPCGKQSSHYYKKDVPHRGTSFFDKGQSLFTMSLSSFFRCLCLLPFPAQIPNRLIRTQMPARRRVGIVGNQHIFILHREERPFHTLTIKIADHIERAHTVVPFVGKNARVLGAKQFIPAILHHRRFLSQRDQPLVITVYRARLTDLLLGVVNPALGPAVHCMGVRALSRPFAWMDRMISSLEYPFSSRSL